jgi:hypothetical protein
MYVLTGFRFGNIPSITAPSDVIRIFGPGDGVGVDMELIGRRDPLAANCSPTTEYTQTQMYSIAVSKATSAHCQLQIHLHTPFSPKIIHHNLTYGRISFFQ